MKIYTKTGDLGDTSLIGGQRVKKNSPQIEAYGNLDELSSIIGMIKNYEIATEIREQLLFIQNKIFIISSLLATPRSEKHKLTSLKTEINENDISFLEKNIDIFSEQLPELKTFLLPDGSFVVSWTHIARTVCRRTERSFIACDDFVEQNQNALKFINRLSDYFFTLARYLAK
jgi:cob(I)alamin adenosyltransferase